MARGDQRPLGPAPDDQLAAGAVVDSLADALREAILSGEVAVGTWLRQQHLASQYGISRTPVREALRALQAQGMVEVVPNRGALVSGPTVRDVREGYAVRAQLEGYAAELAAELATDDQIRRLLHAEELFKEAVASDVGTKPRRTDLTGECPQWSIANDLFHEAVIEAAGNARLGEAIRTLHRSFHRNLTWSALSGNTHLLQQNAKQHHEISRPIEEGRPGKAREAMIRHVLRSGELVVLRLEQLQQAEPALDRDLPA